MKKGLLVPVLIGISVLGGLILINKFELLEKKEVKKDEIVLKEEKDSVLILLEENKRKSLRERYNIYCRRC